MSRDESSTALDELIAQEREGVVPPAASARFDALEAALASGATPAPETSLSPAELSTVIPSGWPTAVWLALGSAVAIFASALWFGLSPLSEDAAVLPLAEPPPASAEAPAGPGLEDEVKILGAAQVALEAADFKQVEALLAKFAGRHPKPVLTEERDALSARWSCRAKQSGAQKNAERFIQLHPRSPYAEVVKTDCGM